MTPSASPRAQLRKVLRAAIDSVDASVVVGDEIGLEANEVSVGGHTLSRNARLVVVAIGKAAAPMAAAVVARVPDRIRAGLVVTKDGHAEGHDLGSFQLFEAGHPVPDGRGEAAARRVLEVAASMDPNDVLLVLLSGGASALVSLPPREIHSDELAATNRLLLESGADIHELNVIRKHLSQISGGRLAKTANASEIVVLAISDVMGDSLDVIGSGPCAPDPSRFLDALEVLERRGLSKRVPPRVLDYLDRGRSGKHAESPKPGDSSFERVRHRIVATNAVARNAAAAEASRLGARAISLGECIHHDAGFEGRRIAAISAAVMCEDPVCLIAGGESVVQVRGRGLGGRNQELALAAAIELDRCAASGPVLLSAGTDGSDGPTEAAGAWADCDTVVRGQRCAVDAQLALANNDSHSFFRAESGLLMTGPTGTNVMDLVLVWVPPRL